MGKKVFLVPWGSESICYWCKKNGKCSLFKEDPEIPTLTLPRGSNPPSPYVLLNAGVKIRFTQIFKLGALQDCLINEFEPDETKLPDSFKDAKIMIRKSSKANSGFHG